jgi:potassium channel subfamily K
MLVGSLGQGIFALCANLYFFFFSTIPQGFIMTEAPFYSLMTAIASFTSATLLIQQQIRNQRQNHYSYTLLDLSPSQRQLILLTMSSILYTVVMADIYAYIENWSFDEGLYWVVSTLTTIGFGDLVPKTNLGRALLPPLAFFGVCLVGSIIWSVRQVLF